MKATLRIRPWLPGLLLCAAVGAQAAGLDADGDGVVAPATDGQLILRHLFGFSGATLTEGVLGGGATRDAAAITAYLNGTGDLLDVDGDTRRDALSDGILILRRLLGRGGEDLTTGALSPNATRDAAAIAAWIDGALGLSPINDTGIIACTNATQNGLPCPVADFPGQDAEHGRDLTHPDPADGHAGFSFTKLDADGAPLPAAAPDWVCVRDNRTGLIWEVKTDDGGLRDKDWTYSWYNPDPATNGGAAGTPDGGDNCFDAARCDTHKYAADVNAAGLCGASDWRLPDRRELLSIVSNDRVNPSIDATYFPRTVSELSWSTSPYAGASDDAWSVIFFYGRVSYSYKGYAFHVRLVRAGQ